jgi:hypothetical protein
MTLTRSRWAAIGAACAVTLGAGGIGLVSAANPDGAVAYVPISPCRLDDTRPLTADGNFGGRNTPLTANETFTLTATGDNGNCTGIPAEATGLSLNVTSVGPTAPTFLTIWPSDVDPRPLASSLNPVPGEPPTPNAVDVSLSDTGQFNIYNLAGQVDVIVDVTGYYIDHDHDDRYYTEQEIDASMPAFGFIAADGTPSENTVGIAAEGVDATTPGLYSITLEGLEYEEGAFAVTVTPACAGYVGTVAAGTEGTLDISIVDEAGAPASDCGFSFTVMSLPEPAPTTSTTTSTSTSTTTTTVAP